MVLDFNVDPSSKLVKVKDLQSYKVKKIYSEVMSGNAYSVLD